jgi:hypothetical protein
MSTNAFSQLLSREQTIGFDDGPLAMDPLWLKGIEPGAFRRQKEGQKTYPFACPSNLLVLLTKPAAHLLAHMEGARYPRSAARLSGLGPAAVRNTTPEIGWSEHSPDAP